MKQRDGFQSQCTEGTSHNLRQISSPLSTSIFVYRTVFQPPLLIFGSGEGHDAGKDGRQKEKRETENEVVGWHQQFNGLELGQILGDSETWHAAVHGVPNSWA